MADKEMARVTISILEDDYEMLKEMAADRGLSLSNYLKNAFAIQRYIKEKQDNGAVFLIEEQRRLLKVFPETIQREIIFR